MSALSSRKRSKESSGTQEEGSAAPRLVKPHVTPSSQTRLLQYALRGAVLLSPLALAFSCLAMTRDFPDPPPPEPVEVETDVGVGGWAEGAVAAWLSAQDEDVLKPYFPNINGWPSEPPTRWASRTTTVDITAVDDDYFAVTVSADVLVDYPDDDEGWVDKGTQYYALGVEATGAGFVAPALPSQVTVPPTLDPPDLAVAPSQQPSAREVKEISQAVELFLNALLSGSGELDRYIAPGSNIHAVTPAPYSSVEVIGIGTTPWEHPAVLVQVAAIATDQTGSETVVEYSLTLSESTHWEVTKILPAAPLAAPTAAPDLDADASDPDTEQPSDN